MPLRHAEAPVEQSRRVGEALTSMAVETLKQPRVRQAQAKARVGPLEGRYVLRHYLTTPPASWPPANPLPRFAAHDGYAPAGSGGTFEGSLRDVRTHRHRHHPGYLFARSFTDAA